MGRQPKAKPATTNSPSNAVIFFPAFRSFLNFGPALFRRDKNVPEEQKFPEGWTRTLAALDASYWRGTKKPGDEYPSPPGLLVNHFKCVSQERPQETNSAYRGILLIG
jgi:hypothetical protein